MQIDKQYMEALLDLVESLAHIVYQRDEYCSADNLLGVFEYVEPGSLEVYKQLKVYARSDYQHAGQE